MNKDQAIKAACATRSVAVRSVGNYEVANDGFCSECPPAKSPLWNYEDSGEGARFVLWAVVASLVAQGIETHAASVQEALEAVQS